MQRCNKMYYWLILGCLGSNIFVTCGKIKERDEPVVVVSETKTEKPSEDNIDELIKKAKEIFELYGGSEGSLSLQELENIAARIDPNIGSIFKALWSHIIRDGKSKKTLSELVGKAADKIPVIRWIPNKNQPISSEDLYSKLKSEYPDASEVALKGFLNVLVRFDETWAGGNKDGKFSRKEMALVALGLAALEQLDFTKNFSSEDENTECEECDEDFNVRSEKLYFKYLSQKMNKQIFLRYPMGDYRQLRPADYKIEWLQLGSRFLLADKLVQNYGGRYIPASKQAEIIRLNGFSQIAQREDGWKSLRKIYDTPLMAGEDDGRWSTLETFNILTDLLYSAKLLLFFSNDLSSNKLIAAPGFLKRSAHLVTIFPKIGGNIFFEAPLEAPKGRELDSTNEPQITQNKILRKKFWEELICNFDDLKRGGNNDRRLDLGEFAYALSYVSLVEMLFIEFDKNPRDGFLHRKEAKNILDLFDLGDARVIDYFYTDLSNEDLKKAKHSSWKRLEIWLKGEKKKTKFSPFEFYDRLKDFLEDLLSDKVKQAAKEQEPEDLHSSNSTQYKEIRST